jgi:hypothetical protein
MSIPADKGPEFSGKDWLHNIPLTGGAGYNINRPHKITETESRPNPNVPLQSMAKAKTATELPPEMRALVRRVLWPAAKSKMIAALKKELREHEKERIKAHAEAQRLGKTADLGGLASQPSSGTAPLTGGACYGAQSQPRDLPKKRLSPLPIKQAYDLGCTRALEDLLKMSSPILPAKPKGLVHPTMPKQYERGLNPQGQHFDPSAAVGGAAQG